MYGEHKPAYYYLIIFSAFIFVIYFAACSLLSIISFDSDALSGSIWKIMNNINLLFFFIETDLEFLKVLLWSNYAKFMKEEQSNNIFNPLRKFKRISMFIVGPFMIIQIIPTMLFYSSILSTYPKGNEFVSLDSYFWIINSVFLLRALIVTYENFIRRPNVFQIRNSIQINKK